MKLIMNYNQYLSRCAEFFDIENMYYFFIFQEKQIDAKNAVTIILHFFVFFVKNVVIFFAYLYNKYVKILLKLEF